VNYDELGNDYGRSMARRTLLDRDSYLGPPRWESLPPVCGWESASIRIEKGFSMQRRIKVRTADPTGTMVWGRVYVGSAMRTNGRMKAEGWRSGRRSEPRGASPRTA
jgi:hypothetical protein